MYSGGKWQLVEQDDLYDSDFNPVFYDDIDYNKSYCRPTLHAYYTTTPQHELYYWIEKLAIAKHSLSWAYNRICEGGLRSKARPETSLSLWLRKAWKRSRRQVHLIDARINELVLKMVINKGLK